MRLDHENHSRDIHDHFEPDLHHFSHGWMKIIYYPHRYCLKKTTINIEVLTQICLSFHLTRIRGIRWFERKQLNLP